MTSPKLTVIIPTLQRPDTLYWTIRTVIEQNYDNFAIIVSDNFSNDNTPSIVSSFGDSRISYINPGTRLSMSRHWEFALSHIQEGYVTILGDDDGLIPDALSTAARLIARHQVDVIGWRYASYNWPGITPHFMIPMGSTYRVIDSKEEINSIFSKNIIHSIQFPSLYGGFINIALINRLKEKFGGQFFHSRIPDFFSASVVVASVDRYLRLTFPLSINATSKHSTGYATVNDKVDQKSIDDLKQNTDNLPFHPQLVFLKSINIAIADALWNAHELIPSFPAPDPKKIISDTLQEAIHSGSEAKYHELVEGLKKIAELNQLQEYTLNLLKSNPFIQGYEASVKNKYSPVSETIYLDTRGLDINNVYDACQVVKKTTLKHHFKNSYKLQKLYFVALQILQYSYLRMSYFPRLRSRPVKP